MNYLKKLAFCDGSRFCWCVDACFANFERVRS